VNHFNFNGETILVHWCDFGFSLLIFAGSGIVVSKADPFSHRQVLLFTGVMVIARS
jgi:hypothetical protein